MTGNIAAAAAMLATVSQAMGAGFLTDFGCVSARDSVVAGPAISLGTGVPIEGLKREGVTKSCELRVFFVTTHEIPRFRHRSGRQPPSNNADFCVRSRRWRRSSLTSSACYRARGLQ